MLGGASALTAQQIENSRLNLQFSESFAKLVPESHLLSGEFVIPPGLHSKKWITFFTPAPGEIPKLTTLHLSYTLADGQREHAVLKFRSKQTMSEWQYHQFEGAKHMRQPAGSEKLVQNVSG